MLSSPVPSPSKVANDRGWGEEGAMRGMGKAVEITGRVRVLLEWWMIYMMGLSSYLSSSREKINTGTVIRVQLVCEITM